MASYIRRRKFLATLGPVPASGVTRRSKPRASAPEGRAGASERLAVVIANLWADVLADPRFFKWSRSSFGVLGRNK